MSEITIKNIKYTNVPNKKVGAKVANKLTQSNIGMSQTVAAYLASENFYTLINAIDIDWNGIEIDANTHINDTSDLITWIATKAGQAGADGVTPHIGQNGNWFIGDTDTNVKAEGTKGDKGNDGTPGTNGTNGKSAYELYVDSVPSGETAMTQAEWLASLKGAKGDKGDTGTVDITNFYTKAEVDQKVADAASGGEIDLSAYAKKDNVYTKVQSDANFQPKGEYLTEHQSLEDYYTKDEIDGKNYLTGIDAQATLYSKDEINTKLADYAKSADVYSKDEIDNFNFVNEYSLSQMVYSKEESDAKYLTSHQSLENYYTKDDIDEKNFVDEYRLSQLVYSKDEVDSKVNVDLSDYYTKDEITNLNFINEYKLSQMVYGKDDVYTKNEVNEKIGEIGDNKTVKAYVDENKTDLTNYYTKDQIDDYHFATATEVENYAYSKEDSDAKYLTSHQSLSNYYNKTEIDNKIARINEGGSGTSLDLDWKLISSSPTTIQYYKRQYETIEYGSFTFTISEEYQKLKQYIRIEVETTDDEPVVLGIYEGYGIEDYSNSSKPIVFGHDTNSNGRWYIEANTYSSTKVFVYRLYDRDLLEHQDEAVNVKIYIKDFISEFGIGNKTTTYAEQAFGHYNKTISYSHGTFEDSGILNLFSIGNGKNDGNRHNAFETRANGEIYISDTTQIGNNYSSYNAPMINLQNKLKDLSNNKMSTSDATELINSKLSEFQESGGQVQTDWDYNTNSKALNYVKNKPVGKFKVSLFREFTNLILSKSDYNNNSYYYISFGPTSKTIKIDEKWESHYVYPSSPSDGYLLDENGQIVNDAPSWYDSNAWSNYDKTKRYILEVDGKRVLCNSDNESNNGIRGSFSATFNIFKQTCDIDSEDNLLETPKDVYYIHIDFPEWLTQSPNVSSLKIYETDETSDTEMCLTWYDINHVYFYDKEEVNNKLSATDWDNNDTTSSQFIKNKPFGTFKVNYVLSIKLNNSTGSLYHNNTQLNDGRYYSNTYYSNIKLSVGDIYYVYLNDELYGTISPQQVPNNSSQWVTSNYDNSNHKPYLDYTGSNRVFAYGYDYGTSGYFNLGVIYDESHEIFKLGGASWYPSIKIFKVDENGSSEILIPIESKYIDYNSYIEDESITNKPFGNIIEYQDNSTYTNLCDNTITFQQTGPSHYGLGLSFDTEPVVGDTVELLIDGVSKGTAEVITNSKYGDRLEFGIGDYDSSGFRNDWIVTKGNYGWTLAASGYSSGVSHQVIVRKGEQGEIITLHKYKKLDANYVDYNNYISDPSFTEKPFGEYYYMSNTQEELLNTTSSVPMGYYSAGSRYWNNSNAKSGYRYFWNLGTISNYGEGDELEFIVDDESIGIGIVLSDLVCEVGNNQHWSSVRHITDKVWLESDGNIYMYYDGNVSEDKNNLEKYGYSTSDKTVTHNVVVKIRRRLVGTKKLDSKYVDTPNLTDYYNKSEVNTLLENAAVGDVDLTSYAKSSDVASTYATKAEVPQIWTGTQEEYDLITNKSETTIYIIK
jgi:hypothetical protein